MNNEVIIIKDMNLALLLQDELKKNNNRVANMEYNKFTKEELSKITKLKISNGGIKNISELEHCTNLKELEIGSSVAKKMTNVNSSYRHDPINDYKFMQIAITDFSVIEKLSNLEYLKIENVSTISNLDLSNLKNLYLLDLSNNQNLTNVKGLEDLEKLVELKLFRNNIKNSIDLEKLLQQDLNDVQLDFDLYPNLVKTNPNIYEVICKYKNSGCSFKFSENLSGLKTNDILPIKMEEMHKKAQGIIEQIVKEDYSEIEKLVAIYYYLLNNVSYDWERLNASKNNENIYSKNGEVIVSGETLKANYDRRNSSYNAIMEGKSVCEGYTNMMHYLLNIVGIDSRTVSCNISEANIEYVGYNSNHSIIRVNIDNGWYYFDPTNDGLDNNIKYFFKTKEEINKTHKLSMDEVIINNVENKVYTNEELSKVFNYIAGYSKERYIPQNKSSIPIQLPSMNVEEKLLFARKQLEILNENDPMYKYYSDLINNQLNIDKNNVNNKEEEQILDELQYEEYNNEITSRHKR